jgi:hypothetical protein
MFSEMIDWDLIMKAQRIARTLGVRRAAGFLRNNRVSLETALWILGFMGE